MLTVRKITHRCPQQRLAVPLLAAGVAVAVVRGHRAVPALPAQVPQETYTVLIKQDNTRYQLNAKHDYARKNYESR